MVGFNIGNVILKNWYIVFVLFIFAVLYSDFGIVWSFVISKIVI